MKKYNAVSMGKRAGWRSKRALALLLAAWLCLSPAAAAGPEDAPLTDSSGAIVTDSGPAGPGPEDSSPSGDRDFSAEDSDGVEAYTITVTTPQDLLEVAQAVNEGDRMEFVTVELKADLDMGPLAPWTPIGSTPDTPFCGAFLGNGHTIRNLSTVPASAGEDGAAALAAAPAGGLFGFLVGAKVTGINLQNSNCPNSTDGFYGGISRTEFTDCRVRWGLFGLLTRRSSARSAANSAAGWSGRDVSNTANDAFYKAVLQEYFGSSLNTTGADVNNWKVTGPLILNGGDSFRVTVNGTSVAATAEDALASLAWATRHAQGDAIPEQTLAKLRSVKVYLSGTFDMKGHDWYPIGSQGRKVERPDGLDDVSINDASILGSDCVIENYYSTYGGLFGAVTNNTRISGITMDAPVIDKKNALPYESGKAPTYANYVGAIVNLAMISHVDNCTVLNPTINADYAGGVVGRMDARIHKNTRVTSISQCLVTGGAITGGKRAGGIACDIQANVADQNVVYGVTLKAPQLGGIAAEISPSGAGDYVGLSQSLVGNVTFDVSTGSGPYAGGLAGNTLDGDSVSYSNNVVTACHAIGGTLPDNAGIASGNPKANQGIRGFITDSADTFLLFPSDHASGLHNNFSQVYWDKTVAPKRNDTGEHAGITDLPKPTSTLTSGGFSGLDGSVWTIQDGFYPRITALTQSTNPHIRHIANAAAVPILMRQEDLDGTWGGTLGVRLPLKAAGGNNLTWTGRVGYVPEPTKPGDPQSDPGRPFDSNNLSGWVEVEEGDTQEDIVAKFSSATAAKTMVYRYIKDGAGNPTHLLLYNLDGTNLNLKDMTARSEADSLATKTFYGLIALEDSMLWENKNDCYPSRSMDNPSSTRIDSLDDTSVYLTFEEPVELNPNAGSVILEYTEGVGTNGQYTWISAGSMDCAVSTNLAFSDGGKKVTFKLFRGSNNILPEAGRLYRITIPAGAVKEQGKNNYSEASTLYVRTVDESKPVITKLKDREIAVHGEASTVDDLLSWLHVDYAGITYGAADSCDSHPAGTAPCAHLTDDHFVPLPDAMWAGMNQNEVASNRAAVEGNIMREDAPDPTPAPTSNMPMLYYIASGPDALTPGAPLPNAGTYTITVFAHSSNNKVASVSFTLYIEGDRHWGDVLEPEAADGLTLPHLHAGLTTDINLMKETIASYFPVVYTASTGEEGQGKALVEIDQDDWTAGVATGRPWRLEAKVSVLRQDGTPRTGTDPDYAPIEVEVYLDMLEPPSITGNQLVSTIPKTTAEVEALIQGTFAQPYPATFDHQGNQYQEEGVYLVKAAFSAADSTLCPIAGTKPDTHLLFKGDFNVTYQIQLTDPDKEKEVTEEAKQELDFWEQVTYDARHREMSNLVARADFPRVMPLWVMTDLRDFSPYNQVALAASNYRWNLYGHTADTALRHDSGLNWFLKVTAGDSGEYDSYLNGHDAIALTFDQVGDLYADASFDVYLGSRDAEADWYLYAVDEGQGKLRYVSDALVDQGWACAMFDKLYHAPYLLSTLPPTSPNVIVDWDNGLPAGLHYGRSQLQTQRDGDPFQPADPYAVTEGDPSSLSYELEIIVPTLEQDQASSTPNIAFIIALAGLLTAAAVAVGLYRGKKGKEPAKHEK